MEYLKFNDNLITRDLEIQKLFNEMFYETTTIVSFNRTETYKEIEIKEHDIMYLTIQAINLISGKAFNSNYSESHITNYLGTPLYKTCLASFYERSFDTRRVNYVIEFDKVLKTVITPLEIYRMIEHALKLKEPYQKRDKETIEIAFDNSLRKIYNKVCENSNDLDKYFMEYIVRYFYTYMEPLIHYINFNYIENGFKTTTQESIELYELNYAY